MISTSVRWAPAEIPGKGAASATPDDRALRGADRASDAAVIANSAPAFRSTRRGQIASPEAPHATFMGARVEAHRCGLSSWPASCRPSTGLDVAVALPTRANFLCVSFDFHGTVPGLASAIITLITT